MPSLRAANSHRPKRSNNSAVVSTCSGSGEDAVSCQMTTPAPISRPAGTSRAPESRMRVSTNAVSSDSSITSTSEGVGAQSATSTDQTTMIMFSASSTELTHPSGGRSRICNPHSRLDTPPTRQSCWLSGCGWDGLAAPAVLITVVMKLDEE